MLIWSSGWPRRVLLRALRPARRAAPAVPPPGRQDDRHPQSPRDGRNRSGHSPLPFTGLSLPFAVVLLPLPCAGLLGTCRLPVPTADSPPAAPCSLPAGHDEPDWRWPAPPSHRPWQQAVPCLVAAPRRRLAHQPALRRAEHRPRPHRHGQLLRRLPQEGRGDGHDRRNETRNQP